MDKNPFTPSDPITKREDFVGRDQQLRMVVDALTHGTNVVITGYRGIGKTSLADQALATLRSFEQLSSSTPRIPVPNTPPFISVHVCSRTDELSDIVDSLLTSLRRNKSSLGQASLRGEVNIGVLKGAVEFKDAGVKVKSASAVFIDAVSEFLRKHGGNTSYAYFLVDEIDALSNEVPLGAFIKIVKESLRTEGFEHIAFLLVGQTGITHKLIQDHPSVGRTFTFIDLPRMSRGEIEQIFSRATLRSATAFDPGIVSEISRLSHGFPSVAQLIGYQCFFVDNDRYVDVMDFEKAITKAAEKLRAERYVADVHDVPLRKSALEILDVLCDEPDEVVNTRTLLAKLGDGFSADSLRSDIEFLVESDLMAWTDSYSVRLKDRLIAIYYFLRSIRLRSTVLIKPVVEILEADGYRCKVGVSSEDRIVDMVATKTASLMVFFTREVKIGVICLPNYDLVPHSLISELRERHRELLGEYSVEYLIAVSEKSLSDKEGLAALEAMGINCYSLDMLSRAHLEYY